MSQRYHLPRNSLLWLLLAQTAALAPLALYLPWFLIVGWLLVVVWRVQVFRGLWDLPGSLVKTLLIALLVGGMLLYYRRLLGLEPMVSLLVSACLLKLLEIRSYRDLLLVVFLSFFLIAVQLLFSQSILAGVYALLSLWLVTTALLVVHQPQGHQRPRRSLRLAGRLLLHSLPLMLLMFVVMPRLGSFWAVPDLQHAAKTGVSDTMAPGDISQLTGSADVAFRVTFDGQPPSSSQLYWRGLVFSEFDGRQWSQAGQIDYRDGAMVDWAAAPRRPDWLKLINYNGNKIDYSVIMEPSQQMWLYSLEAVQLSSVRARQKTIGLARDFRLLSGEPVRQRLQYHVSSYLDYQFEAAPLPDWRLRRELQLPAGFNPQTQQQARQWLAESGSHAAYIERVLKFFTAEFSYSLNPPLLGKHSVDDFLWNTKRGFCEHFASSFVVLMRAAGIPARVVVGYQGGEFNRTENYLIVRQYDAHAWTEVWLPARGWVRIDPTSAVAPSRVEQGLRSALTAEEAAGLAPLSNLSLLNLMQLQWDALNYRWHRSVLGYDNQSQVSLLRSLLGEVTPQRLVLFVAISGGVLLGLVALHLYWTRRPVPLAPAQRCYRQFVAKLARRGLGLHPGESPQAYLRRLQQAPLMQNNPALYAKAQAITALFEQIYYQDRPILLVQLKAAVRSFSP